MCKGGNLSTDEIEDFKEYLLRRGKSDHFTKKGISAIFDNFSTYVADYRAHIAERGMGA